MGKGNEAKSRFRNVPMEESQLADQMDNEMGFSQRMDEIAQQAAPQSITGSGISTGVLPVQIKVPTSGQVYRFAKTIVKPEDKLEISVFYTRNWLTNCVKWILILLAAVIVILSRKILSRLFQAIYKICVTFFHWFKPHKKNIQIILSSWITIVFLFAIAILILPASIQIGFLLFVCGIVLIVLKIRKRESPKKKTK